MAALRATPAALSLNPTEYAAIQSQLLKIKSILKTFMVCAIRSSKILRFSQCRCFYEHWKKTSKINAKKKRHETSERESGNVLFWSNTNKKSLVNSWESDTTVSAASSSQTNQTEGFDTFIAQKVNPRPDSENATNYSQSFLPTRTRFIRQTTFHPEFYVNLNNHTSTLRTTLSQCRSAIYSSH